MSTYYRFFIGYRSINDMFHLFGPYDKFGNLRPIIERSRSFITDIVYDFCKMDKDFMDDDIKKEFGFKDYNDNICYDISYMNVKDLPKTDFIKSGYYLLDEVIENMSCDPYDIYFNESYTKDEYSLRLQNAIMTNDIEEINRLKKFVFYSYPDYTCKEYLSFLINNYIQWNCAFDEYSIRDTIKERGDIDYKETIIIMETC